MKVDHKKIEKKWQDFWEKEKIHQTPEKGEKFYHLVMFPYPSGDLHMGHWYNFVGGDVYARKKRAEGYKVMSPMGFDAFGLPAENAAIKKGIHPETWTYENIKRMREQIKNMGPIYDWEREIVTCAPEYYKWTQWIFVELFKKGLAYKKEAAVNFCPSCKTVLANEQVVEGVCERCDSRVIQKNINQWFLNIERYVEELFQDLSYIDWPKKTKMMQKNWIGRSEGAKINFDIELNSYENIQGQELNVAVFTTRPETILGVSYVVISPEHPLIQKIKTKLYSLEEVEEYISNIGQKTERERMMDKSKIGVKLEGIQAINPVNKERIPVFIAEYVLVHYGEGAIMGVPAHDSRDFQFANINNLPVKRVIESTEELPYEGDGRLINSGQFSNIPSQEAKKLIVQYLKENDKGEEKIDYKLRDWLVSRQRYWGAPIPIIYCENCYKGGQEGKDYIVSENKKYAIISVPENRLPVELPYIEDFTPLEEGGSPLNRSEEFKQTKCPYCGGGAIRETDTLDTFVCSSWYYLRYVDSQNSKEFANKEKLKEWMPVDIYIGGAEHSVLHLLYSRFVTKALRDMGHLSFSEPFIKLRHQGTILAPDGKKMSKSRGNVINPSKEIEKYGVDVIRIYLCFMAPYDQGGAWDPQEIKGVVRFLEKFWELQKKITNKDKEETEKVIDQTIRKVTEDTEELKFNTAISSMMSCINEIDALTEDQVRRLIIILSPYAPHLCEEMWNVLDFPGLVVEASWPKFNNKTFSEEKVTIVIQVDGKVRGKMVVEKGLSKEEVEEKAQEKIQKWIKDKKIEKVFFVKDKLINFVI